LLSAAWGQILRFAVPAGKSGAKAPDHKAWSLAHTQYRLDYDGNIPYWNYTNHRNNSIYGEKIWFWAIEPYVGDHNIYSCPARQGGSTTWYTCPPMQKPIHYACSKEQQNAGFNMIQVKSPTDTLVLGDARHVLGGWVRNGYLVRYIAVNNTSCLTACCGTFVPAGATASTVHSPGANIAFFDGHGEFLPYTQLKRQTDGGRIRYWRSEAMRP